LYEDRSIYVKQILGQGEAADFLRSEPSSAWQDKMRQLDSYAANVEAQAKAARVPVVVALLPERRQTALISAGEWPAGNDPYAFGNQACSIMRNHGESCVDLSDGFRTIPNAERDYFPVDGHPTSDGHVILTGLLAKKLTSAVPALGAAAEPQTASAKSR
jgi:hypothetical protein